MFFHRQELQFTSSPSKPDAVFARRMQEVLGGQYGEITVAMQYGFQAWNAHEPGKYRDLLFGIGAEEFGHVEMLAVMIAQLLEKAPVEQSEDAMRADPVLAAVIGGTDVQAAIVAGAGVRPVDSNGNPWQGSYITASGNLLADFTANANAEMQGRIQVARLYNMTDDHGVRDLLSFLLARDTMHQNQWMAVLEELGPDTHPIPNSFPSSLQKENVAYSFLSTSVNDSTNATGRWTQGTSIDGKGIFQFEKAVPTGGQPVLAPADKSIHAQVEQGAAPDPGFIDKVKDIISG